MLQITSTRKARLVRLKLLFSGLLSQIETVCDVSGSSLSGCAGVINSFTRVQLTR